MMSVREKLANHVMSYINSPALDVSGRCLVEDIASDFRDTTLDHILGKPEPTLDDVCEEAKRVYGAEAVCTQVGQVLPSWRVYRTAYDARHDYTAVDAPTISSAYAALRALPSKEEK